MNKIYTQTRRLQTYLKYQPKCQWSNCRQVDSSGNMAKVEILKLNTWSRKQIWEQRGGKNKGKKKGRSSSWCVYFNLPTWYGMSVQGSYQGFGHDWNLKFLIIWLWHYCFQSTPGILLFDNCVLDLSLYFVGQV